MIPEHCNTIEEIRTEIDNIDHEIVCLIGRRAGFVKAAARFKKSETAVKDEHRVAAVIESKRKLAETCGVSAELVEAVYRTMIGYFVNEELEHWKSITR